MELVFEERSIDYLRRMISKTAGQELEQELIVPDSYPDCGRIVFTGACAVMRGKECRDGSVTVTGGVRAGLLYVPEDGSEARALECYLPFSIRTDDPAATAQMYLAACCRVRAADARLINSRKILVRTNVVCELTGYLEASQTVCSLTDAPGALQTKTESYRCVLPREYCEKTFTMTEDLELPAQEPQMQKLIQYWLTPEITEQKLTGSKAVFKGQLHVKALYLSADGAPEVYVRQLPFSQYCELREDYEDDELRLQLCITGSEMELSQMEGEPQKLLLTANLLCQCLTMQAHDVTITQDAYATRGEFTPQWQEISLPCLLDRKTAAGTLRGSVPKQARAVVDSTLYLDAPSLEKQNGSVQLQAPATVNILYYDTDGALQSAIVRDQVSASIPAGSGALCQACVIPGRDGFAAPSGGGIDVRYDVSFDISCCCDHALQALCGGTLEEGEGTQTFCVVVKTNPKTQSLWEIAKQYRTRESDIAGANGITTGEAEQGELLLIPM